MTSCDLDPPHTSPWLGSFFSRKTYILQSSTYRNTLFAEISVCKKFYYRKVYFFKQQSVLRSWCVMPKSSTGPLMVSVDRYVMSGHVVRALGACL